MNLVKWFRKNNTKVMAVVVVVLMVGFVGGTALTSLLHGSGGMNKAIAHYGPKQQKITPNDRNQARSELEMLQALGAGQVMQYQDLRGVLLGEMLFSQDRASAEMISGLWQHIQRNRYRVSEKQLSDMYDRTVPTDIYWILLRDEAQAAGFHVRSEDVGQMLGRIIPQLYNGSSYSQAMQSLVSKYGVPEEQILATFGKLWAVLQYAEAVCSLESSTTAEIRHLASRRNEALTAELVQLKASYFEDKNATPSEAEMVAQFQRHQDSFAGQASEANPYGFGYKLPDRVQLEYIALDMNDIPALIERPTAEEAETYYQRNRDGLYTREVPSDPNDPNSPVVPEVERYADVVDTIMDRLTRERVIRKTEQILLEARNVADANLPTRSPDHAEPTIAALADEAGDYQKIALDLGQKHSVSLYYGRTGMLSAADIQADDHLRRLSLTGYGKNPVALVQMLFSPEAFGEDAVKLMSVPSAQVYRSIGPARDPRIEMTPDLSGQIMAVVRIVAAEPAAAPEKLDTEYSTKTLVIDDDEDEADSVHSVKEGVIEDLRILAAWETTKTRAQEFVQLANEGSWDEAVSKFNELYGEQAKDDPNDPNVFEVQNRFGLQRVARGQMELITTQTANIPGVEENLRRFAVEQRFVDRLYSLIPLKGDSVKKVPLVLEFKPNQSFFCLKNVSIQRLDQKRFQDMKTSLQMQEDHVESQSLSVVHFNPQNILKRANFAFAQQAEDDAETEDETSETPESQEDAA